MAAAHHHRRLVLGAWGCGVFRNDPAVVATAFARALQPTASFDQVVFAVYDRQPGSPVYQAFADILGKHDRTGPVGVPAAARLLSPRYARNTVGT